MLRSTVEPTQTSFPCPKFISLKEYQFTVTDTKAHSETDVHSAH